MVDNDSLGLNLWVVFLGQAYADSGTNKNVLMEEGQWRPGLIMGGWRQKRRSAQEGSHCPSVGEDFPQDFLDETSDPGRARGTGGREQRSQMKLARLPDSPGTTVPYELHFLMTVEWSVVWGVVLLAPGHDKLLG